MDVELIAIKVDDQKMWSTFYTPKKPAQKLAALFVHGWTGKPNEAAAMILAQHGYYCLTISLRGHGKSDGDIRTITTQDSFKDALAAYDFLKARLPHDVGIIAIGSSYGSYISALLSAQREIAALSLRVPANYADGDLSQPKWGHGNEDPKVAAWRLIPITYAENHALKAVHDMKGGVQIIEAENDEVVPHQTVLNYCDAVSNQKLLDYHYMKTWPHSLGDDSRRNQKYQEILLNWLSNQ